MVMKVIFVGLGFICKFFKYEWFIRFMGFCFIKVYVMYLEFKCIFNLDIIGVKKNFNGFMYMLMGVIMKGIIIEVCLFLSLFFVFLFIFFSIVVLIVFV